MKNVIMTVMELVLAVCVYTLIGLMAADAYVDYGFPLWLVAGGAAIIVVMYTTLAVEFHKLFNGVI